MNNLFKNVVAMALCAITLTSQAQEAPRVRISSEEIAADLYLPDPVYGYYRAARFDWSGVIPNLNFNGHTFFGQWFETYDPYVHESIVGPVEAFDPLGYSDIGKTFTKIGVGLVEKIDTAAYHFGKPYPIINHGRWDVDTTRDDQVSFAHTLDTGDYPYRYEKVVRLEGNRMFIEHVLTNTGNKIIDNHVFNHNFFVIDNQKVGPGYTVRVPYEISYETNRLGEFAELDSNQIRFVKPLGDHRVSLRSIGGYRPVAADYDITVENHHTGVGVRITCDRPISKFDFWAATKTLCPEPFIHVKVEPADSFSWTIVYDFFTL